MSPGASPADRLNILVLANQWSPDRLSGYARVVGDTARELAARGHMVTALVPRMPGKLRSERASGLLVKRDVRHGRIPMTLSEPIGTRRALRRIDPATIDVVLAHSSTGPMALRGEWGAVPLVVVFHASGAREVRYNRPHLPPGQRALAYLTPPLLTAYGRFASRRAHSIIALSDFSRALLDQDDPVAAAKTTVLGGAVDTQRFRPADDREATREHLGVAPDEKLILTVRRLEPRMGIEQLLGAIARIDDPGVRLVIAGTGTLDRHLRELASDLEHSRHRVFFTGQVPDDELRDWYRASDLFVLPTAAYEGFGIATAEALACGVPVIGTPVGATPELLRPLDPRLVATGSDAAALADAIASVLPDLGPEMRRRAREHALSSFSWDSVIEGWEQQLVAASGRHATR